LGKIRAGVVLGAEVVPLFCLRAEELQAQQAAGVDSVPQPWRAAALRHVCVVLLEAEEERRAAQG
jgi:hypothetical protein